MHLRVGQRASKFRCKIKIQTYLSNLSATKSPADFDLESRSGKTRRSRHGFTTGTRRRYAASTAMTSRLSFHLLRRDFDKFLFATVGEEINGIPLSVLSALMRLEIDPWNEARRLSSWGNAKQANNWRG
jgi:hypothetical protein